EAAAEIAEQLRPRLTPAERKRIVKRHTANPRAFEAHLKGRYQLAKRTLDGFTKAIAFFEQAIGEDREYALAYAGLADCWTLLSALGRHDEALVEIRRAHELDPLSLIISTAVGRVLHFQRRYEDAIEQCRRTLDMDAQFVQARLDLGMACAQAGRHDEAIAQFESALPPGDP